MPAPLRPAMLATVAGSALFLAAPLVHAAPLAEPAAPAAVQDDAIALPTTDRMVLAARESVASDYSIASSAAAASTAASTSGAAEAQIMPVTPVDPGKWQFTIGPYLWFAGIKSKLGFTPRNSTNTIDTNVDMNATQVLGNLNFAFMFDGEARRDKFSVNTDFIYSDVLQTGSRISDLSGPRGRVIPISTGGKVRMKTTVWTLTGGYDVYRNDRAFIQLFAGVRMLNINSKLDWNFTGPFGDLARAGTVKETLTLWDGVIGARGEVALGESPWKFVYYGDVGAGGSQLTYQLSGVFAYAMSWGDIGLGWRYLEYQQDDDKFLQHMSMNGPVLSARFHF